MRQLILPPYSAVISIKSLRLARLIDEYVSDHTVVPASEEELIKAVTNASSVLVVRVKEVGKVIGQIGFLVSWSNEMAMVKAILENHLETLRYDSVYAVNARLFTTVI